MFPEPGLPEAGNIWNLPKISFRYCVFTAFRSTELIRLTSNGWFIEEILRKLAHIMGKLACRRNSISRKPFLNPVFAFSCPCIYPADGQTQGMWRFDGNQVEGSHFQLWNGLEASDLSKLRFRPQRCRYPYLGNIEPPPCPAALNEHKKTIFVIIGSILRPGRCVD